MEAQHVLQEPPGVREVGDNDSDVVDAPPHGFFREPG
jgi:hypothetical protein